MTIECDGSGRRPLRTGASHFGQGDGRRRKGDESEWKFAVINPECLGLCQGPGLYDRSAGSQTFRSGAEADWRAAGRGRGAHEWFSKETLWIIGMKAQRLGRCA